MNGPHELTDVQFITPQDVIVSPLHGRLHMRSIYVVGSVNRVAVYDSASQTLAVGVLPNTTNDATQATQWLLDITGARLNCETAPLAQNGSFVYY